MDIRILHMVEGARAATGLTVVIDVFRAMTVETFLMRNHAARIIPVGDVQIAFDYKAKHPDTVLCGERKGIIIDGFDYGNSPSQLEGADLTGKTVVHTTSAGTQGIANAIHADEIIAGSLVSARAIAEYIRRKNPESVSLVCMGLMAIKQTEEDNLCAEYIKSLLEGRPLPDLQERIEGLKTTSGAKFFDPARQHIYPERDFLLCTQVNSCPFILRLKKDTEEGLDYMERVDVMGIPQDAEYCTGNVSVPPIHDGDLISKFTMEQVICFPDAVKANIAYGNYADPGGDFDAALVLGGPDYIMESRARAAAQLYHAGRVKLLITTGGVYWDSPYGCLTEAQTLARYLMDAGVPGDSILIEDRASTTPENMTCSRQLLTERFGTRRLRLAVVTSRYHVVRSTALAKAFLKDADIFGIRADYPLDDPQEYLRDPVLREWVTKECRCLWSYVNKGLIPDFPVK